MGKNRKHTPTPDDLRSISDYYKLNTKSVDDLVDANKENAPEVSQEELKKYRAKGGLHLPDWLKAVLIKAWFAGSVCFFIFWGLGLYVADSLDMLVILGIVLGLVTDLLVNNVFRFCEKYPGGNDDWMMFPKKSYVSFLLNLVYGFVLLFCVYNLYQVINGVIIAVTGAEGTVPFGVEPIGFGIFYMGFDMLFIGMKHLFKRIISEAKDSAGKPREM